MPPRQAQFQIRPSQCELPILPFLAPRAFSPWHKGFHTRGNLAHIEATASHVDVNNAQSAPARKPRQLRIPQVTLSVHTSPGRKYDVEASRQSYFIDSNHTRPDSARKVQQEKLHQLRNPQALQWRSLYNFPALEHHNEISDEKLTNLDDTRPVPTRKPQLRNPRQIHNSQSLTWRTIYPSRDPEHRNQASHQESSITEYSSPKPTFSPRWLTSKGRECRRILHAAERVIPKAEVRFRKVSLSQGSPSQVQLARSWSAAYAKLSWKYDPKLNATQMPSDLGALLNKQIKRDLRQVKKFVGVGTFAMMAESWPNLSLQAKEMVWPYLMLSVLKRHPAAAIKFLVASASRPYPPSYAISDSLEYIVCYYLYENQKPDPQDVQTIFHVVLRLLGHIERGYFYLTQKTIYWVLVNLNIDDAWKFYSTLELISHPICGDTLLHFVEVFTCSGRAQYAVDILRKLHGNKMDFTMPKLASVFTTLLQQKYQSNSKTALCDSEVIALMLNLGLQPNLQTYTVLVKNAIDNDDPETAWQIHDMMLENNVSPNAYTYSILLSDAKLRMDWPTVDRITAIVRSKQIIDGHIATGLLHTTFLRHEGKRKSVAAKNALFNRMLTLYCEHFDSGPMKELLGGSRFQNYLPTSDGGKIQPSKHTLAVMLIALIRSFSDTQSTLSWYRHFRELLQNGHPTAVLLAESTYLYDAVIMSLGRVSTTMHLCTNVVRDMLNSCEKAQEAAVASQEVLSPRNGVYLSPQETRLENQDADDAGLHRSSSIQQSRNDTYSRPDQAVFGDSDLLHCQPSAYTWSVLLKGFMDHGQPRAAEKVIKMMKDRGIKPNQVTWNSLVIGYAKMQDIPATVQTVERLEKQGLRVDEFTMIGLGKIRNRNVLVRALSQKDELHGREPIVSKVREMELPLADNIGEVTEHEELHLSPEETKAKGTGHKIPEVLKFGFNDLIFPSEQDKSKIISKCYNEMLDINVFNSKRYEENRKVEA